MADVGKDPFQNLKKVLVFLKNIKMLRFYGQVLENHIIIFKLKKLVVT